MKAIEVAEISKSFGKIKALDKVSLTVEEGELFGLIGPDAAGKSTLFNILVTLLNPDQGNATILGLNLMKDYKKLRQMIGYLPGQFSLYGDLSCWETLEFFATMYGESIEENYDLIKPIWEQLQPFKNRKASALSGGMKQKLALCCALIHKPKVLFLDEPTTGVDPVSRKELWEILQKMKSVGITVFVSTSYMDEATICNRIALIQKGEILGSAKPQQIIDAYQGYLLAIRTDNIYQLLQFLKDYPARNIYASGQYVNVVFNDKGEADKMIEIIEKNNIQIRSKEFIQPTIEDCFIQLMRKKDE